MAILKHFNVKNSDYSAALRYFVFEHDERSKPLKDEQGNFILRENYLIDGINCCPMSYDVECRTSNRQWKKNLHPDDIKQHHFILSFEPSDIERGLTLEKAQTLGMEFARKHFAGHQCLVATHADGHNGSRNIHCHIALNSLRIEDLPEQPPYSEYERDRKAGYKFHPTQEMMRYLKSEVMSLCRANGLGQVELNQPAKKKVTDKEYWAQKRSQKHTSDEPTKFQTELDQLRQAIDTAKRKATSVEDFKLILSKEYGISIRDKRGRWSYQTPNRKNGVTARRLGADYSMEAVIVFIDGKNHVTHSHADTTVEPSVQPQESEFVRLMVCNRLYDLNAPEYRNNPALQQWAKIQNLKELSRRFNAICENGLLNADTLNERYQAESTSLQDTKLQISIIDNHLQEVNLLLRLRGQLNKSKPIHEKYQAIVSPFEKHRFYHDNQQMIDLYNSAMSKLKKYRDEHHTSAPVPSVQALKEEKSKFFQTKETLSEQYSILLDNVKLLSSMRGNVMEVCINGDFLTRAEFEQTFGAKMSIKKNLNRTHSPTQQQAHRQTHKRKHEESL